MTDLDPSKILFACFVWGNSQIYMKELLIFFKTLNFLGGKLSSAKKITYFTESIDSKSLKLLSDLGVETKIIKNFSNNVSYMNKPQNLKQTLEEDFELLIMLDTDIVISNNFISLLDKTKMGAKQDEVDPIGLVNWKRLFQHFNITFPSKLQACSYSDEQTIPYFNSAVLFIPKQHIDKIYESWQYFFDKLIDTSNDAYKILKNLYYADQIALTCAIHSSNIPYYFISDEMNFSTHIGTHKNNKNIEPYQNKHRQKISKIQPYIIHHHHRLTKSGLVRYCYYDNVNNVIDKINSCLTKDYASNSSSIDKEIKINEWDSELLVDNLYLEILQRFADKARLSYFSSLLKDKKISTNEIRKELLESDEYRNLKKSDNIHGKNELVKGVAKGTDPKNEARTIVDELYFDILERSADESGLEYYSSLLKNNKITVNEIRNTLLSSDEYKRLVKSKETKKEDVLKKETRKVVDNMYKKILKRPADNYGLYYWGSLLENNKITKENMRKEFLNSYEYKTFILKPKDRIKNRLSMLNYYFFHPEIGIEFIKLHYNIWKDGKSRIHKYINYNTNIEDVINQIFSTSVNTKQDLNNLQIHCKQFLKKLELEKYPSKTRPYPSEYSLEENSGLLLYTICKILKPEKVVETGVAYGLSSCYILQALHENKYGKLYSIDYVFRPWESKQMLGAMIPENLKDRWELTYGKTSKKLKPLLSSLGSIDLFIHDSTHTYSNMIYEFQTSWKFIKEEGILISDDVGSNNAFYDFCNQENINPVLYSQMNKNFQEYYRDYDVKGKTFLGILKK